MMIIPRIARGPDKIFVVVRNDSGQSMADGDVVLWSTSANKNYGSDAVTSTVYGSNVIAGVISGRTIPVGDYGLCQIYGYHDNVRTSAAALAATTVVVSGTSLNCTAASGFGSAIAFPTSTLTEAALSEQILGVCIKTGSGNRAGIMIRCM